MQNLLSLLPLLACPVVMGLIMWMMMRGKMGQAGGPMKMPAKGPEAAHPAGKSGDEALAGLRMRLSELEAEQGKILVQITRPAANSSSPELHSAAPADSIQPESVPGRQADQVGGAIGMGSPIYAETAVGQKGPGA